MPRSSSEQQGKQTPGYQLITGGSPAALLASALFLISFAQAFISASLKPGLTARLIDTAARSKACSSSIAERTPTENFEIPPPLRCHQIAVTCQHQILQFRQRLRGVEASSGRGEGLFFNVGLRL